MQQSTTDDETLESVKASVECYCPNFHQAVELIGRRWTGAILLAMLSGLHQYTDIRDAVPGLSDRLLTERLKELESAGIASRCTADRTVAYGLTEKGAALAPTIQALGEWGANWLAPPTQADCPDSE